MIANIAKVNRRHKIEIRAMIAAKDIAIHRFIGRAESMIPLVKDKVGANSGICAGNLSAAISPRRQMPGEAASQVRF